MRRAIFTLAALAAVTLVSAPAQADGEIWYGRLDVGANQINDIDFSSTASNLGISVTAAGKFEFDPGLALSGALGVKVTPMVGFEAEFGYAHADYDSISGTLNLTTASGTTTISGSANVDGDVSMITGMLNVILTPLSGGSFEPQIGAGFGLVQVVDEINTIGTLPVNSREDITAVAAQAIAGFDIRTSGGFTLGARYRFFWANTGDGGFDDATTHIVMATGTVKF